MQVSLLFHAVFSLSLSLTSAFSLFLSQRFWEKHRRRRRRRRRSRLCMLIQREKG
jgi:hypothetical protein